VNRKLRKPIQNILLVITIALGIMILTINDISLKEVPIILLASVIVIANIYILRKYGKGIYE